MTSATLTEVDREEIIERLFYVCRMIKRRAEYHVWEFGEVVDDSLYSMRFDDNKWPGQARVATEKKLARVVPPSDKESEAYRIYREKCTPLDDLPTGPYVIILDYFDIGVESVLMDVINVIPRLGARECLRVTLLSNLLLGEEWTKEYINHLLDKSGADLCGMYEACCYMRRVDVHKSIELVKPLIEGCYNYGYDMDFEASHHPISSRIASATNVWIGGSYNSFDVFLYGHYMEVKAVARTKMSVVRTILNGDFVYRDIGYGKPSKYLLEAATCCIRFARCDCSEGLLRGKKILEGEKEETSSINVWKNKSSLSTERKSASRKQVSTLTSSRYLNEKVSHDCGQAALSKLLYYYRETYPENIRGTHPNNDIEAYHVCMLTAVECGRIEMINLILEVWSSLERKATGCILGEYSCTVINQCVKSGSHSLLSLILREGKCGTKSVNLGGGSEKMEID